ncbi:MAG: hypothetical protein JJ975_15870 [Bacteroidia bacterium]|nr:hypothetical protein [Bacteroidia bacterium]
MKHLLRILICSLLVWTSTLSNAQTEQDTSLIPCYGNVQRAILATETAMFFNLSGINLNKYDWKNPTLNCHINSVVDHSKKFISNKALGYTSVSLGLSGLGTGILLNNISGDGTALMVIGDYYQKNNLY